MRGDGGQSSGGVTIGGALLLIAIVVIAAIRGDIGSSSPPAPSMSSLRPVATTSTTAAPEGTDSTVASVEEPTTSTTVSSTSTTTPDGILVVDGDAKKMTTFVQPAPCIIHLAADGSPLPDPSCTPGAISTRVQQDNITFTICVPGYTDTIRPSSSQTNKAKAIVAKAYNLVGVSGEYDHLIPLELGGANDVRNLWLEPGKLPNGKDAIETKLKVAVCKGQVTLVEAQHRIATDWTRALDGLNLK